MLASSFLVCRLVVVCPQCSRQLVEVTWTWLGDASAPFVVACCSVYPDGYYFSLPLNLPLKSVESQLLMWYAWSYGRILLSFCCLQTPY
ncbi:hypothetical protein FA15DRAFT_669318 [Coprinopsis marcescibilis]|uniref:Secreted protein n=1 Tax=Coprinopsis marcescibilis TaxID=230819 RepID=A0A5C3KY06_COPMA|nr:hypothetical protein FA15DRAFT_669318 [Coprinopsis marcescibilis]